MSFGEGDLHIENRELREYNASLLDKIDSLKDVNGKLCAEINRQERVIEGQRDRIGRLTVERDAYFEMVKRVQADCDKRDRLIRDMLRDFEEQMHEPTIYPQTWYVAHKIRAQKLGIEVCE